mgnify:CR=1 FL=1
MDISIVSLIATLIVAATPILLAATGELIVEKSGVLNLGVEGMMQEKYIGQNKATAVNSNGDEETDKV